MIKFFRKIRQNLLIENKTGKFLKYAIGEIVLVVIGILIALQINNWNNRKETKLKEMEALSEIFQDLKGDKIQLTTLRSNEANIVKSMEIVLTEFKARGSIHVDSLHTHLGKALVGNRTRFITTAYNVLLSSGIGLVQDKDIRYSVANYYEKEIPSVERDGLDTFEEWYDDILPFIREEAQYWQWGEILVPNSINSIFENQKLYQVLKTNIYNHVIFIETIDEALKENNDLLEILTPLIEQ
jgi:hypothetical protein